MENPFKPTIAISDSSQFPDIMMIDSEVRGSSIIRQFLEKVGKYKSLVISGYLGEGKTTTLLEVTSEISEREKWLTVSLSMKSDNVIADFAAALKEYELIGLNQSSYRTLQDKKISNEHYIIKVLTGLIKKGYNTLVSLDNVVVNDDCELLKFAAFYRRLATKKIAISTLLAATPDVTSAICSDMLLAVLLAPQIVKFPLNELQAHVTYHDVFKKGKRFMTGGACSEAARYVSCSGYTFQVVGYLLWENTAEGEKIPVAKVREIKDKILSQLSKTVFPEIFNKFSEEEKLFLKVMIEESWYDRTKIASIIRVLEPFFGIDKYRVEKIKSTLVMNRIIFEADSEVFKFRSPLFREFVKNQLD